MFSDVYDE